MFNFSQIPITISLIAANVILSLIAFSNAEFMDKGVMWPYRVARERQYFRFVTSGFLHADLMHLIFNMFTLFYFG
ncbi:MAG TPA: rhomboid family intramembrane serine protease, partial [Ferruginibacter sp.]|nr:rhomboid family intramembrane serine protease [Ferruginibacter sp.]